MSGHDRQRAGTIPRSASGSLMVCGRAMGTSLGSSPLVCIPALASPLPTPSLRP